MAKSDIVLITFPFSDLSGNKLRPAVVLFQTNLNLTVCFITTQMNWKETSDILVEPNSTNDLKKPSLVRISKIATLDKSLSKGLLGTLNQSEIAELNTKLKI